MSLIIVGDLDHIQTVPATVEAQTSQATGHVAANTLTRRRSETWRSTAITGAEGVDWDMGSSVDINCFAALTNALPGGTYSLKIGEDNTFAVTEYSESGTIIGAGAPTGRGSVRRTVPFVTTFTSTNSRYARFQMTDTDHSDGYHELEVVMIGQALTLPGVQEAFAPVLRPAGAQYESRQYNIGLRGLTLAQKTSLEDLLMALGVNGRMIITPSTTRTVAIHREALYCRLVRGSEVQWRSLLGGAGAADFWGVDFRAEEVLD